VNVGAPADATPTDAPEYFGLDENASGKLEDYLNDEDVDNLRRVNKESRRDTATLTLGDWRRDEDGSPRGPGQWEDYGWTASFTRGRDGTGTRLQYVATFDDYNAIRGNEGGVQIGIRFRIEDGEIAFANFEDDEFPFAGGSVLLNIPEWNLSGKYEFDYGSQSVRYLSERVEEEEGRPGRTFDIRIRMAIESIDPAVYVSFGFTCRVNEDLGSQPTSEEDDQSDDEPMYEDTIHTANWYLRGVTIYRDDE
jgi:hypothetical protein